MIEAALALLGLVSFHSAWQSWRFDRLARRVEHLEWILHEAAKK